jgi:hypothetical protein
MLCALPWKRRAQATRTWAGAVTRAHVALAMKRSERSGARWRFRLPSDHDERRGMTLGLQIGAPPLHVGECVPLGREQAHAVSPDPYGPAIVSALDDECCRCWSFGHETT